jgi:hypothetical protein
MNQFEITTLDDIKQELTKDIQAEISRMTLGSWSVEASGSNFLDIFDEFSPQDLANIVEEFREGNAFKITLDLTEDIMNHLEYMRKRYGDGLDEDKTSDEQDL